MTKKQFKNSVRSVKSKPTTIRGRKKLSATAEKIVEILRRMVVTYDPMQGISRDQIALEVGAKGSNDVRFLNDFQAARDHLCDTKEFDLSPRSGTRRYFLVDGVNALHRAERALVKGRRAMRRGIAKAATSAANESDPEIKDAMLRRAEHASRTLQLDAMGRTRARKTKTLGREAEPVAQEQGATASQALASGRARRLTSL